MEDIGKMEGPRSKPSNALQKMPMIKNRYYLNHIFLLLGIIKIQELPSYMNNHLNNLLISRVSSKDSLNTPRGHSSNSSFSSI